MRYGVARLCGGKALMISPEEVFALDMARSASLLSSIAEVKAYDDMMIVMTWKEMDVTVYNQGKIMYHPLEDKETAIRHTEYLLSLLR